MRFILTLEERLTLDRNGTRVTPRVADAALAEVNHLPDFRSAWLLGGRASRLRIGTDRVDHRRQQDAMQRKETPRLEFGGWFCSASAT